MSITCNKYLKALKRIPHCSASCCFAKFYFYCNTCSTRLLLLLFPHKIGNNCLHVYIYTNRSAVNWQCQCAKHVPHMNSDHFRTSSDTCSSILQKTPCFLKLVRCWFEGQWKLNTCHYTLPLVGHTIAWRSDCLDSHLSINQKIINGCNVLNNNPYYIITYYYIRKMMTMDYQNNTITRANSEDIWFQEDEYLVWCRTDEQTQSK